jgi:hypothetical protein
MVESALKFYNNTYRPNIVRTANDASRLIFVVVGSWLAFALAFWLLEPYSMLDCLYWSMTTISTVGYGDILPTLAVSKILTMGLMAWSIFYLVPCAVTHIVENVRVDKDKDTHEEQEWREDMLILMAEKQGLKMGVDFPEPPADN